jgi:large subunit ribosomal protein L21
MVNLMYAIANVAGQQVRMSVDERTVVPRLAAALGERIEIDDVRLLRTDTETLVGSPQVQGAKVIARVVDHGREPKVLVVKMKRRKGYRRLRGHRQPYTTLDVEQIVHPAEARPSPGGEAAAAGEDDAAPAEP